MNSPDSTVEKCDTPDSASDAALIPAMRGKNLSFYYGSQKALEGVS
ncbi:MAG: phosphate ABC transporter ATP-binding protein, partial [Coleofasciculus sp. Co-bin14]|nr:phosphate ABC transporter ATP-binding protein [Coleofasciculus sp. Co-bin14]